VKVTNDILNEKELVPTERKWKEEERMGSSEEDFVKNQTEPNQEDQLNGRQANNELERQIFMYNKQIETQVKRLRNSQKKKAQIFYGQN
jgi:hypothetical protein